MRELKNTLKKAVVMSDNDLLDDYILSDLQAEKQNMTVGQPEALPDGSLTDQLARHEKDILMHTLSLSRTTREMARRLGTSQPTIVRRLKKHGLPLPSQHNGFNNESKPS